MSSPYSFTYVRIPAEDGQPTEELSATTKTLGDALNEILKPRFGGGSIKNVDGLRAEYGAAVDEKMEALNSVAAAGSVEVFALVRPSPNTMPVPHAGTYLYFDEMGQLKDLPVNRRAAQIAATCGLDVESPFLGDVFIGRVQVQPSPVRSASFALSELDSSSAFFRSAPSENAQYQMAMHEYEKAAKEKTAEGKGSYKWTQTPDDLEVTVQLPAGCTKRDLKIEMQPKQLRVLHQGAVVADIALLATVRPDEMTYTLDTAKGQVAVMVEKVESVSWSRLEAASAGQIL